MEAGDINLPDEFKDSVSIQSAILVDALLVSMTGLLGIYVRAKNKDSPSFVAFIDNGACLTSRARGGYKGFRNILMLSNLRDT